jgi:hypothetical protein
MLIYDDVWWFLNYDDVWWCMMMFDDVWWCMMMYDESWWIMMIYDDLWWLMMNYADLWWFMMIHDDLWWFMMMCDWRMLMTDVVFGKHLCFFWSFDLSRASGWSDAQLKNLHRLTIQLSRANATRKSHDDWGLMIEENGSLDFDWFRLSCFVSGFVINLCMRLLGRWVFGGVVQLGKSARSCLHAACPSDGRDEESVGENFRCWCLG